LLDKWLYAIKNLATLMERPKALQEAVFKRLFEQAEIAAFNRDELYDYRESQKDFWDLNSAIETAEKKGRAEGRAEGLAEGEKKGIIKTAKNMKAEGLPASLIAKMTGLPEEEIDKNVHGNYIQSLI
jgi:predicted transposase/invertase (TIGR01784 family)